MRQADFANKHLGKPRMRNIHERTSTHNKRTPSHANVAHSIFDSTMSETSTPPFLDLARSLQKISGKVHPRNELENLAFLRRSLICLLPQVHPRRHIWVWLNDWVWNAPLCSPPMERWFYERACWFRVFALSPLSTISCLGHATSSWGL